MVSARDMAPEAESRSLHPIPHDSNQAWRVGRQDGQLLLCGLFMMSLVLWHVLCTDCEVEFGERLPLHFFLLAHRSRCGKLVCSLLHKSSSRAYLLTSDCFHGNSEKVTKW